MKYLILLVTFMSAASGEEIVRRRYSETLDFSRAQISCSQRSGDSFFAISVGDITVWANQGLPVSERECYQLKFQFEDELRGSPVHSVGVTDIEITRQICDRKRVCLPDIPAFQSRVDVSMFGVALHGYKYEKPAAKPKPVSPRSREGCEYFGKLGGGWVCP